jgi:sugar lactone lactonase YvrE
VGGHRAVLGISLVLWAATLSGSAQQVAQIYSTNEWQNSLQLINFQTGKVVNLYSTAPKPDDLTINSAGQLIYSLPNSGTVDLYDPSTGINTILVSGIGGARDLTVEPGGNSLLISKYGDPAEIWRYSFITKTASVFFPKTKGISAFDGTAYDAYGNLYAVASHNTIIQIDPVTAAIKNTLVTQPHNGIDGGDGLTYDSYTNSLWTPNDGKTSPLGYGLIQIPVQPTGFVSASPGLIFHPLNVVGMDGIKSDGNGNLYIGAIHTAFVYNIPTGAITYSVVTKGADGVALVPGTY